MDPTHQLSELPGHWIHSLLSTHATVWSSSWVAFSSWAGVTLDLPSIDIYIRQLWYDRHFTNVCSPNPHFKTNYQNTYAVCTPMFIAALFTITKQNMETFQVSLDRWVCCSVTQSCPIPCESMDCSTPGFPVLHHLLELAQTHVHWVDDAIQLSHPLLSPSPPAFNLSQYQSLFQWVISLYQVAKV